MVAPSHLAILILIVVPVVLAVLAVLGGAVWLFIKWMDSDRDEPGE